MGNILYNIILILFAINLFEVSITPALLVQILVPSNVTGISAAGLNGVAVVPTISVALIALQIQSHPSWFSCLQSIQSFCRELQQRQCCHWPFQLFLLIVTQLLIKEAQLSLLRYRRLYAELPILRLIFQHF